MKKTRIISFVLVLFMLISIIPLNVFVAEGSTSSNGSVTVKVEGYDRTILSETKVPISNITSPTAINAISEALIGKELVLDNVYGYIKKVDGLEEYDLEFDNITPDIYGSINRSGWQYVVNNELPSVGVSSYELSDGDDVVLYYTEDYLNCSYAYFSEKSKEINKGNFVELTLKILHTDSDTWVTSAIPLQDAYILIDGALTENKTDANGKANIKLDTPGKHVITAQKLEDIGLKNGNKVDVLDGNPSCIVNVIEKNTPSQQLEKNLAYLVRTVDNPTFGTGGGEWSILSLARGEYKVPAGYYDIYYNNVVNKVKELMPASGSKPEGRLDRNKGTEHSRLILGLTAIGKDVTNVVGYNILEAIADYKYMIKQGINGPIFALLALDSHQYEIPQVEGVAEQSTREKFITYILDKEINKGKENAGGWALSGSNPDPDITAMAIQGLTPYYHSNVSVKDAVDRAINWLSSAQKDDGGFASWGSVNSESIAQVVVALTGLGLNPHTDPRFIKNGNSAIDALMTFAVPEGGFMHIKPGGAGNGGAAPGTVDGMATDQGTYALVAYDRLINGKNSLYDMTDVKIGIPEEPKEPSEAEEIKLPAEASPTIDISEGEKSYRIPVKEEDRDKNITINIPENKEAKVVLELPLGKELPEVKAVKGDTSILIPQGTQMIKAANTSIELITPKNISDVASDVESILPNDKKLEAISIVFSMGGSEKVEFDDYLTITLKGMAGKEAAYIQEGKIYAIEKYESESLGLSSKKEEYSYDSGEDLIIKTKHFTDFIVYSASKESGNSGGGNAGAPSKSYITLSIDKKTINKGYVLKPTKIEITNGESVWSVLKRILDGMNLDYEYTFTPKYNSVYVESIDGDGEFDHGSGSGWMYNVNGWYPNYGASLYKLKDGDVVEWRYTTNLGADLGEDITKWNPEITISGVKDNENVTEGEITVTISAKDVNGKRIVPTVQLNGKKVNGSNDKYILKLEAGTNKLVVTAVDDVGAEAMEEVKINYKLENTAGISTGNAEAINSSDISNMYDDESSISSWAKDSIIKATSLGIVQGHNNMFNPKSNITRAEFTKIVVSVLNLEVSAEKSIDFADISVNDWFYPYINAAYKANIISGIGNEFKPNDNITREQMAAIIVRALGLKHDSANNSIEIKDYHFISDWAKESVEAAIAHGLMMGNGDNFDPQAFATREMATVVAMRVYDCLNAATN